MLVANIVRYMKMRGHVGHWTDMIITLQVLATDVGDFVPLQYRTTSILYHFNIVPLQYRTILGDFIPHIHYLCYVICRKVYTGVKYVLMWSLKETIG